MQTQDDVFIDFYVEKIESQIPVTVFASISEVKMFCILQVFDTKILQKKEYLRHHSHLL